MNENEQRQRRAQMKRDESRQAQQQQRGARFSALRQTLASYNAQTRDRARQSEDGGYRDKKERD